MRLFPWSHSRRNSAIMFWSAKWLGWRECHLAPDWLLIYKRCPDELVLGRTGSHSDLF